LQVFSFVAKPLSIQVTTKDFIMRYIFFAAALSISALGATASISPAAAQIQDRYCLQGRIWGYPGNCQFSNYNQCMASASGTDAYCGINPAHAYARQQRRGRPYYER
jgi:hypothetical protein